MKVWDDAVLNDMEDELDAIETRWYPIGDWDDDLYEATRNDIIEAYTDEVRLKEKWEW
jgi:hypothetical protein